MLNMANNVSTRYSSSPDLSDPPSVLSGPTSPNGYSRSKRGGEGDEIVVDPSTIRYDGSGQPMLTKDGVPRRKPGLKPGSRIAKRGAAQAEDGEKAKRPRKPKDPNAPPVARKRKAAPTTDDNASESRSRAASTGVATTTASRQTKITDMAAQARSESVPQKATKRESLPESMSKILNADPDPSPPQVHAQPLRPTAPSRTSGTNYDPIRSSNYDPVRETMVTHSYSSTLGSPRAPTGSVANRPSASPSIASLVEPTPMQGVVSPSQSHTSFAQNQPQTQSQSQTHQRKPQESNSMPTSPNPVRKEFPPPPAPKASASEIRKPALPPSISAASKIEIRPSSITTIGAAVPKRTPPKNQSTASSSPRIHAVKDSLLPMPGASERSILDFGKAEPGSELVTPSIVLNVPLNGETNKYVNFMRMAEEQYGWEALHPRQAEHKARKARIAAASAALAQTDSSREGDEMSVDESDNDDSNVEMGGVSGPDKPEGKPVKKKRHFKEDEYDKEDDFVDDSELLWEEQAAASRDGFFVYSGPLVPEVEKPEAGRGDQPKRGRGSRGGRGGGRSVAGGAGRGRGGGPGSRGGVVRKPRMTKADKEQMNREKAEREATYLKSTNGGGAYNVLQPGSPPFSGL